MKARGAFNLFFASTTATLTLSLLNVWGRPEWFDRFPLSYALRLFQTIRAYASSCMVFFAALALAGARGRRREGFRQGVLFAVCFAPLAAYSVLTLARADLLVLDVFLRADTLASFGFVFVAAALSVFGRRDGLPLYAFYFRPETFPRSTPAEIAAVYSLTPRESEVLVLLLQGKSNRQIAESLFVSLPTVKTHLARIFEKTGAGNRLEVFARCYRPTQPEA